MVCVQLNPYFLSFFILKFDLFLNELRGIHYALEYFVDDFFLVDGNRLVLPAMFISFLDFNDSLLGVVDDIYDLTVIFSVFRN